MNMLARGFSVAMVLTLVVTAIGCVDQKAYDKLKADNQRLDEGNRELQAKLSDLKARYTELMATVSGDKDMLAARGGELAKLREQIEVLKTALADVPEAPQLPEDLEQALNALTLENDLIEIDGTRVRLKGDVLFDSGKAVIKPDAKKQLDKLAKVIAEKGPMFYLRVDGHTDSDPIKASAKNWTDNWELSYARARAVQKALAVAGVDENRTFIAAFADTEGRVPNDTPANKQKNRRVELLLLTSR